MSMPTLLSRAAGGDRTRNYQGARFTFLADALDTGGAYSLMEVAVQPAGGPPPHTHTHEDEAFYVLDGDWTFRCGGTVTEAGPGTLVFLPRGLMHTFTPHGDACRALLILSPAGLEEVFWAWSEPMPAEMALPPLPDGPPSGAHVQAMAQRGVRLAAPPPDGAPAVHT